MNGLQREPIRHIKSIEKYKDVIINYGLVIKELYMQNTFHWSDLQRI